VRSPTRFTLLATFVAAVTSACSSSGSTAKPPSCPGNPLLGVYDPSRLEVRQQCATFQGVVTDVGHRSDGDLHVDVRPDSGYEDFLNDGNRKDQGGALVVEIMPGQSLPAPTPGEHLAIFGTWVHDTHNDWNEIHPVWSIDYLDRGTTSTSLPPKVPEYQGGAND
jgi:hypothetical protein